MTVATREKTIETATGYLDTGLYISDLAERVAIQSESERPESRDHLYAYQEHIAAAFRDRLGFKTEIFDNPIPEAGPILIAEREEDPALPTIFCYGHGDVVLGMEGRWENDASPWELRVDGNRIYGRGTADNKGQHTAVMLAMEALIANRGNLGFNCKFMIDTCEETGSPGLREFCAEHREHLSADLFIASDGPRMTMDTPATFGGARGAVEFDLICDLREGGHHSGNWGGLIANPGVLVANAIAALVSPCGRIEVRELVPTEIPPSVRKALEPVTIDPGPKGPSLDTEWWGEPGLTDAERVFGWTALEVLAFKTGNPDNPVNAVPPTAWARCQVRHTIDIPLDRIILALRKRLEDCGIRKVEVKAVRAGGIDVDIQPTRLDPDHPAVDFVATSIENTLGKRPIYLPNAGGTICNDCFADIIGMPTMWVPLSYPTCNQHAPNEHVLKPLIHQGLAMLAGIFWDCGDPTAATFLYSQRAA